MEKATEQKGRLIIVSNRMPMTVGIEDGTMKTGPSAGGWSVLWGRFSNAVRRRAWSCPNINGSAGPATASPQSIMTW